MWYEVCTANAESGLCPRSWSDSGSPTLLLTITVRREAFPFLPSLSFILARSYFQTPRIPPSMLSSPDSSMIEDLTVDELRWLEASEILDFPTSPTDSFHLNDRVVLSQRKSRFNEDFHRPEAHLKTPRITTTSSASRPSPRDTASSRRSTAVLASLPTPPRTPPRPSQPKDSSPSEWLYRRPKTPSSASRTAPSASALSSTLTLPQVPSRETSPELVRTTSGASSQMAKGRDEVLRRVEEQPAVDGGKASGNASFWTTMLRPRSRSLRSIPQLKTIPSQSQVDILHSSALARDAESMSRRSPSISSNSSSTLSSAASSYPDTPISTHPDPFGAFVTTKHRRNASQPSAPRDYRAPPLPSSCPSRSILARASSVSTKDSATANKSVKFVEVPTVHYASAGHWDADAATARRVPEPHYSSMDVDDLDNTAIPRSGGGAWTINRTAFAGTHWGNATEANLDMDLDPLPRIEEKGRSNSGSLKRLMSLSRRSSVSTSAAVSPTSSPSHRRKSSASSISTATITPSKPLPATPNSKSLPPVPPPKPAISGPFVLGSHPATPASPAQSTASLRSMHRHKPKSKSMSAATGGSLYHALEEARSTKNSAARSVRSLASSIRSEASTTPKFKSWLSKVGVGNSWPKN